MKKKTDQPGPTGAPEWADFFEEEGQYDRFVQHVKDYFSKNKIAVKLSDGTVKPPPNSPFGSSPLGLQNLAQNCQDEPEEAWPESIKGHFDSVRKILKDKFKRDTMMLDFMKIQSFLAVRIYHSDIAKTSDNFRVCRFLAGDIYEVLVFDWPESISSVKRDVADKWGLPDETLFQIGKENIRQKCPVVINELKTSDGFPTFLCTSDHFFAGNILFDLPSLLKFSGLKGALVGFPNRHAAIIAPYDGSSSINVLQTIVPAIYSMNLEGPGSISNHVFWWSKDHGLVDLPIEFDGETLDFSPPAIFLETLEILPHESL